ncbi:MAG: hypothetical protein PVSMB7_26200 [Chloroflexota bacterium]
MVVHPYKIQERPPLDGSVIVPSWNNRMMKVPNGPVFGAKDLNRACITDAIDEWAQ